LCFPEGKSALRPELVEAIPEDDKGDESFSPFDRLIVNGDVEMACVAEEYRIVKKRWRSEKSEETLMQRKSREKGRKQ